MNIKLACLAACLTGAAACGSIEPAVPSLEGTWIIASFSDSGTVGVTTGTMTFLAGGSWSALGTVTYPGEPLDSIVVSGTWVQHGLAVTLSMTGGTTGTWDLAFSANQAQLTGRPPIFTVITLTRQT